MESNIFSTIFEKAKKLAMDSDSNVCMRFYPLMGVKLDEDKERLEKVLKNLGFNGARLVISVAQIRDLNQIYTIHTHTLLEGLTQPQVNLVNNVISGNFLIIAYPDNSTFERSDQINLISSILRINFGNFMIWPVCYRFHINFTSEDASPWQPMNMPNFYEPYRDGPFLGFENGEEINIGISELYQKLKISESSYFTNLIGSLIEDAAAESNIAKKVFHYWSAIDSISQTYQESPFIKYLAKGYFRGENIDGEKIKFLNKKLLVTPMRKLRHAVIHEGYKPVKISSLERYLQLLILELLVIRQGLPCKRLIEKFVEFNKLETFTF